MTKFENMAAKADILVIKILNQNFVRCVITVTYGAEPYRDPSIPVNTPRPTFLTSSQSVLVKRTNLKPNFDIGCTCGVSVLTTKIMKISNCQLLVNVTLTL